MKSVLKIIVVLVVLFGAYWALMSLFGVLISVLMIAGIVGGVGLLVRAAWRKRQNDKLPEANAKKVVKADREAERALKEMERREKIR
ncbi:MAG: hypothetical protein H7308_18650 [Chthonomonadaceae bacterium]|nr:hypothetical protein [Chthonomonadaceae bacterium]